jgi:hypothetical protein
MATNSQVGKARVDNQMVLTTKPLEDLVQDRSNQVTDLIEAQKRYNSLVKPIWYYILTLIGRDNVSWGSVAQVGYNPLDNIF